STAEFLRRQLGEVKQRLEEQEQRVSAFKTRYLGETPQHIQENLVMLERLNTALRLNTERQSRAMERREGMARQLAEAESFSAMFADPGLPGLSGLPGTTAVTIDPTAARLTKLQQELTELRTRFSDRYPDVVRLKAEIAALEKQVAEAAPKEQPSQPGATAREPAGPSPYVLQLKEAVGEVEAELKALRVEEKRLHQDLDLYQQRVQNTPRREQEFQVISRDYATTSDLYKTLLQRYEEAQLAETLEQRQKGEQFRVLETALPPKEPFAPKRSRLLLGGLAVALGLAMGAIFLAEELDTSFHTIDELR